MIVADSRRVASVSKEWEEKKRREFNTENTESTERVEKRKTSIPTDESVLADETE
jgi:hypothetical protein